MRVGVSVIRGPGIPVDMRLALIQLHLQVRGFEVLNNFFARPSGVGGGLNIYMFRPRRLMHACALLVHDRAYFMARLQVIIYQALNPGHPWLTREAINFLDQHLSREMHGVEFGSGRSTRWLGMRLGRLISVEHNHAWYDRVNPQLRGLPVDYHLAGPTAADYLAPVQTLRDDSLDLVLVDGAYRDACIALAARKVRRGGIIVVDNADAELNVSPLAGFRRLATSNGVWQTDIYERR